jgi:protein-disulfide isomerase
MRPDASAKLAANRPKDGPSKILIGAVIAAVAIIVIVVVVIVNAEKSKSSAEGSANALSNGGGVVAYPGNASSGAPTVDLYEDFQCPFCKHLETASGAEFDKLAKNGDIKLVVHPMTILDRPGTDDSVRAANAAYCADDQGKFVEFRKVVFANQPQEGVGYTNDQLKQFGTAAGITGDAKKTFDQCVDSAKYKNYVKNVQTQAEKAGVFSTPTVKINGKAVSNEKMNTFMQDPSAVAKAVKAATK